MSATISEKPNINAPLIEALKQISLDIVNEANFRIRTFNLRKDKFEEAKKKGKELTDDQEMGISIITPTPGIEEKSGHFDWFYHILHRKEDLEEQLKYLHYLAADINYKIREIQKVGDEILYSADAQERMIKFYFDSAEEMQVDINDNLVKEWFPEEWKLKEQADAELDAEERKSGGK